MSGAGELYEGWCDQWAHPWAPLGGTGPGYSRPPGPLHDPLVLAQAAPPHPLSPVGLKEDPCAAGGTAVADLTLTPFAEELTCQATDTVWKYPADDCNQAAYALLGEMSRIPEGGGLDASGYTARSAACYPTLYPIHYDEAKAIASTILNRQRWAARERTSFASVDKNYREKKKTFEAALAKLNNQAKSCDAATLAEIREQIKKLRADFAAVEKNWKKAKRYKDTAEDYLRTKTSKATLKEVVTAPTQYVGYGSGKKSYADFSAATRYVRIRTYIRWEIAKAALKASAIVDPPPYAYLEFRTCSGAAATPGRTKIGGNEFFLTVADKKAAIDKAVEQGK